MAQEMSPSKLFFYPLVLNLYSIPILSLNLIFLWLISILSDTSGLECWENLEGFFDVKSKEMLSLFLIVSVRA